MATVTAVPNYAPAIESFTKGFLDSQEAAERRDRQAASALFEAAKANPELFDSPIVRKHVAKLVGGNDAYDLLGQTYKSASDKDAPAFKQLVALGIVTPQEASEADAAAPAAYTPAPAPPEGPGLIRRATNALGVTEPEAPSPAPARPASPYRGAERALALSAPKIPGASITLGPNGPSVTISGEKAGEAHVNQAAAARMAELRASNPSLSPVAAQIQAARDTFEAATRNGMAVPKWVESLATGHSENEIKLALEEGKKHLDVAFAGQQAAQTEIGKRTGAMALPQTAEEADAAAVNTATAPDGTPLTPGTKAGALQQLEEERAQGKALATGRGTTQAKEESDVRTDVRELGSVVSSLETFAPLATSVLTSNKLKAKGGVQAVKLYLQSGEGKPGIAALSNLAGLVPRITKLIGGDVGNLAQQEQKAYRSIVDGTWQTAEEFVTNMLVLNLAMDRIGRSKAESVGLPPPKKSDLLTTYRGLAKTNPAVARAVGAYEAGLAQLEAARVAGGTPPSEAPGVTATGQPVMAPNAATTTTPGSIVKSRETVAAHEKRMDELKATNTTPTVEPAKPLDLGDGFTLVPAE